MTNPRYIIRRATEQDLLRIQQLNQKLFEKEFAEYDDNLVVEWPFGDGEKYFSEVLRHGYVVVGLFDDEIIGYLAGSFTKYSYHNEYCAEIDNMFVEAEYRNSGVGTMLVEDFMRYCEGKSVKHVKVTAYAANQGAIDFYRKNGFADFELTLKKELL